MHKQLLTIFLVFAALSLNASAATVTTTGTFGAFDHEVNYYFAHDDPPDRGGNVSIGTEAVLGLEKFDSSLGTLNKITINAAFDYAISASIEVYDVLDFDNSDHSASFTIDSDGGDGDRGHVYVSYSKGSSRYFMTNDFFTPSVACSGSGEPCANFETSAPISFDAPVDILNSSPQSGQIDQADFVGMGPITKIAMSILLPEGSIWTTDNVSEAEGSIGVAISAGSVSIEYDYTPTVVPVPAAVWLFVSAIGGLFGAQRFTNSKSV